MTREIGLVSCVKTKRDDPTTPKNLYTSPYFEKMRAYAERFHDEWWILSAKYGLLDPDGEAIAPYDETLSGARVARKRESGLTALPKRWIRKVFSQVTLRSSFTRGQTTTRNCYP